MTGAKQNLTDTEKRPVVSTGEATGVWQDG